MSNQTNKQFYVGVVEKRDDDDLKLGRTRVRLFDLHTDNKQELPTSDLPLAHLMLSGNNSRQFKIPKEGEVVLCSFLDGNHCQEPVILGVIPGLVANNAPQPTLSNEVLTLLQKELEVEKQKLNDLKTANTEKVQKQETVVQALGVSYSEISKNPSATDEQKQQALNLYNQAKALLIQYQNEAKSFVNQSAIANQQTKVNNIQNSILKIEQKNNVKSQKGFSPDLSQSEVNTGPKQPSYNKDGIRGEPSVPRVTRTAIGTSLDWVNGQLAHECDTTKYVRLAMGKAKALATQAAMLIRKAIQALLKALGVNAAVGGISSFIKDIADFLQDLAYWVKKANNFMQDVVLMISKIKAIIDYILSLPQKLLDLFRKCLDEALNELKRGFFDTLKELTTAGKGVLGEEGSELLKSLAALQSSVTVLQTETLTLLESPSKVLNALSSPSTMTPNEVDALIIELFPDNPKYDSEQTAKDAKL